MIVKLIVMRKIFLFVILLCWGIVGFTQDGVNFEHLSFKEALDKAQAENKLVFVDCYTSWCGPCRNMTEHIFPQEKVGDYFNSKFVCVKYDMEKGEGPELGKRFGVRAYPTFLVLRTDGTLVHKLVGGRDADGIIRGVEEAFDASKASGAMEASYQAGERGKEFLLKYLKTLIRFYDPLETVVAGELMDQLSDKEKIPSEKLWELEKRIKKDRRHPGVIIDVQKSTAIWTITNLLKMQVISRDDLEGFSSDLIDTVNFFLK